MAQLGQTLLYGLAAGAGYVLIALGFTMVYGILERINFAHGEVYMLGAYVAYLLVVDAGLSYWLAIPAAVVVGMAGGLLIERTAFRPLRGAPQLSTFVSSLALAVIVQNLALQGFGAEYVAVASPISQTGVDLGFTRISGQRAFLLVVAVAVIVGMYLFIKRTSYGRIVRAAAQNPEALSLMGVNVNRVVMATFAGGAALAALAGVLLAPLITVTPFIGSDALLKAFVVVIIGGLGSIPGTVVAGLGLGLMEGVVATYVTSSLVNVFSFGVLIVVLLLRPHGIVGVRVQET